MRRHYAPYFKGYPDFKEYRMRLVQSPDPHEIRVILNEIDQQYAGFRLQAGNPAEQAIEN